MKLIAATHRIVDVSPKNPEYHNPWHQEVLGKVCAIVDLTPGSIGWLLVDFGDVFMHRFRTSIIQKVDYEEDTLILETENTVYRIRELQDGEIADGN